MVLYRLVLKRIALFCLQKPEELETVRQCLRRLRGSLAGHDPQHRTLDLLEEVRTGETNLQFS